MKMIKRLFSLALVVFVIFSSIACTKKPQKPNVKSGNEPKPMPKIIKEIERDTLKIMVLADMVPYFSRVIVEKKAIEEEKKMEQTQMNQSTEDQEKKGEQKSKDSSKTQEKPSPMTIKESIFTELIKREKIELNQEYEKPPKDIDETWKKINSTIKGIHDKWNVLEPLLMKEGVSSEAMTSFEDTLDSLTIRGIDKDYLDTITYANTLTSYLPKFISSFKTEVPPAIYTLKYLLRDTVLSAAIGSYSSAQSNINKIKEQEQGLKSQLIENKKKSTADQLDASINNLQKSIHKKNLNLIKINGSIVMKNIILMEDQLSNSMSK